MCCCFELTLKLVSYLRYLYYTVLIASISSTSTEPHSNTFIGLTNPTFTFYQFGEYLLKLLLMYEQKERT